MVHIKRNPAYVIYKMGKLLDQSVSGLDPFGLDDFFKVDFVKFTNASSPSEMLHFVEQKFSGISFTDVVRLSEVDAMAATRDVAMLASALTKLGIRVSEVPVLEMMLLKLADKTYEVPADTVFSYGPRNPSGQRRRTFTGSNEEEMFIRSFTDGMDGLIIALASLEVLQEMDICDPMYAQYASEATDGMRAMVDAIFAVRKIVTPEVFTFKLRPFFDPKTIGGRTYFAPGGAQMPISMVDLLLWGVGETDRVCLSYWNENLQYLPTSYRSKIESISRGKPIIQSVAQRVSKGIKEQQRANVLVSIDGLLSVVDQIIRFRAPHLGIAKANMKIRQKGALGSGGYDTSILQHLIVKTQVAKSSLCALTSELCS